MKLPTRRTRAAVAAALAASLLLIAWRDELLLRLPSRQMARVEAMRAAFEQDYDGLPRAERSRRYRELIEAEKDLPEALRRAYAWDQAQERYRDYVAMLRRFAAMTPEEKTKALDEAIDETRETLKRSDEAVRRAKAAGAKPRPQQPVEEGRPIVWTADELQLRDNYARAIRERKAQRQRAGR